MRAPQDNAGESYSGDSITPLENLADLQVKVNGDCPTLIRGVLRLSADFRAARSALLFGEFVVELAAVPPGDGGVGEVG
jgi:hypothetical protein